MSLARVVSRLSSVLVRRLGDGGGPRADQVDAELDSLVTWAKTAGRCIARSSAQAGNTLTGEDDLHTFTLPAGTFAVDNDYIEGRFAGTFAANANSKTWRVRFGGTQIAGAVTTLYNNLSWVIHFTIIRLDSDSVKCIVHQEVQSNVVNSIVTYSQVDSLNFGAGIILKVTGEAVATNDILQQISTVTLFQQ